MNASQFASRTRKRRISVIAATAALICTAVWAATPVEVQKARHEHYEKLGEHFKTLRDNSRGNQDWALLEKTAAAIEKASVDQGQWFPKGSGPEAGKTRALPEIWTKPAEFSAAQKMFTDRTPAVTAAVKAKDGEALVKAFREVGGACKNCHDNFRAPE